jgi:hypothetical protein
VEKGERKTNFAMSLNIQERQMQNARRHKRASGFNFKLSEQDKK